MIFAPITLVCQDGTVEVGKETLVQVSELAEELLTDNKNLEKLELSSCTCTGVLSVLNVAKDLCRKGEFSLPTPVILQAIVAADFLKAFSILNRLRCTLGLTDDLASLLCKRKDLLVFRPESRPIPHKDLIMSKPVEVWGMGAAMELLVSGHPELHHSVLQWIARAGREFTSELWVDLCKGTGNRDEFKCLAELIISADAFGKIQPWQLSGHRKLDLRGCMWWMRALSESGHEVKVPSLNCINDAYLNESNNDVMRKRRLDCRGRLLLVLGDDRVDCVQTGFVDHEFTFKTVLEYG